MADFLMLMHDDATSEGDWNSYLTKLRASGHFEGGSGIGAGVALRKDGVTKGITRHITGYLRFEADDIAQVEALVAGNPVFENGGTVEIRELPKD
ncbi:hypothetical protein [Terricaulis sp.]|uniref:hypothetical protein n=1 Tax=Terricaulis sp. TaxID=2768686 RepID=UPI00378471D1